VKQSVAFYLRHDISYIELKRQVRTVLFGIKWPPWLLFFTLKTIFLTYLRTYLLTITETRFPDSFRQNSWAPQDFFSRGGQIRSLRTKVPQWGPGIEPRWAGGVLGAKLPEANQKLCKYRINNSYNERSAVTTNAQNTLYNISNCPMIAHACWRLCQNLSCLVSFEFISFHTR